MRSAIFPLLLLCVAAGCGGGGGTTDTGGGGGGPQPPAAPLLVEEFDTTANLDAAASDADWGVTEPGVLSGQPVPVRTAYVCGYERTWSGVNSGRGEYVATTLPLLGTNSLQQTPPASAGRRMQVAVPDTQLGEAGIITGVAWGPARNRTVQAFYPNVKLRMGYVNPLLATTPSLSSDLGANYDGPSTTIYDGPYSVAGVLDVGNTPGLPTSAHVGGYAQGAACSVAPGGWNAQLFDFTGFQPWPPLTTYFAWDPGDPGVAGDRTLLFDMSAAQGDATQQMRAWFAVTFPCSGILIGGHPAPVVFSTYEGPYADPPANFTSGVVNPAPMAVDLCVTFGRLSCVAQSLFMAGAFGDDTLYLPAQLTPWVPAVGASVQIEYQGADGVLPGGVTIDPRLDSTPWVLDVTQCNGMRYLRWRISLVSGMTAQSRARVDRVAIPMADATP